MILDPVLVAVRQSMEIQKVSDQREMEEAIAVLRRAWWETYAGIISPEEFGIPEEGALTERYETARRASDRAVLLATEGEQVIGTGSLVWGSGTRSFVGETDVELRTLSIDPIRWNEGFGTRLLTALSDRAAQSGDRLVLETLAANEIGTRFYQHRDFSVVDEGTFEIDERSYPTLVFARSIDECSLDRENAHQITR